MTDTNAVLGYAWPMIASAGEKIAFHLSSATLKTADATLVRVRCADPDPAGPGIRVTEMAAPVNGELGLSHQPLLPGSCAVVADAPALVDFQSFTVGAFIWPTMTGTRAQTLISRWQEGIGGWKVGLDEHGHLEFVLSAKGESWRAATAQPLVVREWALVGGAWDAKAGVLRVMIRSLDSQGGRERRATVEGKGPTTIQWPASAPLVIAAQSTKDAASFGAFYDGKIDRPRLHAEALGIDALRQLCDSYEITPADARLVAAWNFSLGISSSTVTDISTNRLHGTLRQMPARGMTGANWDGSSDR